MTLTVKTELLQDLVAKSSKGAGNNKMIPITSLMCIKLESNTLTLITTDATNYLYVSADKIAGEDFYVVVQTDIFSKLIGKLTCEEVTLTLDDAKLTVNGNGKYSIELPLDEDGRLIKYPNPVADVVFDESPVVVNKTTIDLILNTAKASLSPDIQVPCYTGYYCGDKIVTTDTFKICGIDINLFNKPVLVDPRVMDLLDVVADEKISVWVNDDVMVFRTPSCMIYGRTLEGIEDYQIDAISGLFDVEFSSSCKVPKSTLLQLLDRLALFVGAYDKNGVYLTFAKDGLIVSSKQSSGMELIHYIDSTDFTPFTCCLDITMFAQQVKAQGTDAVEIFYGADNAIKMIDGNVTQIIALSEDDRND